MRRTDRRPRRAGRRPRRGRGARNPFRPTTRTRAAGPLLSRCDGARKADRSLPQDRGSARARERRSLDRNSRARRICLRRPRRRRRRHRARPEDARPRACTPTGDLPGVGGRDPSAAPVSPGPSPPPTRQDRQAFFPSHPYRVYHRCDPRRGISMSPSVRRNDMKRLLVVLAAAVLVAPAAAMADSEFSIVVQGGATKYNQSLSGSDVGAAYGARLGVLPTPMLGLELGYLGTQNNI